MVTLPSTEEGSVTVVVRVRPQTPREQEVNRPSVVQVVSNCALVFDPDNPSPPGIFGGLQVHEPGLKKKGKNLTFVFDRVFGENSTQAEVFENTTKGILNGVLNGYNCSVFAYGATGAGKTHTMLGSEKDPGIMYFTMVELYKKIEARKEEKHCEVLISYQEVYNEQIHDLLEPKGPLAIREDPEKGVVVHGLSYHKPKSAAQLLEMLRRGNLNRTQHPTDINATSSRSHAIFQIHVKQQDSVVGITQDLQMAKMSLIDLAGSERASVANTRGERLREGANINRSLLALINVLSSLADAKNKKSHIPYRDSKLTRLLKDSIGGNCRTIMIAAISPSALSYEDTYNTLKYANRAKEIKVLMKSNVVSVDCPISQYVTVCEQLKAEVADLRERLRTYEENVPEAKLCVVPAFVAPSSVDQDETVRSKESCLGCKGPNKDDCAMEVKVNDGTSFSRGRDPTQDNTQRKLKTKYLGEEESEKNPGPSSAESSNSIKPQEKLKTQLQKMDKKQLERLVMTILQVAQRQYTWLKEANLLTPDAIAEFGELNRFVHSESDEAPWGSAVETHARPDGAAAPRSLNREAKQLANNAVLPAYVPTTECVSPEIPSVSPKAEPNPSTVFKTPRLVTKKRRKSTENTPLSERSGPSSEKGRAKRRRKACSTPQPLEWAIFPQADCTSTPVPGKTKSPSPSGLPTLPHCPSTVTKGRVPLTTSTAQNCSTPASRGLNTTFDLCENPCPPKPKSSAPECPAWDGVWPLENRQGAPFIPRASMPVFTMKGSSIPRSSSLASKASIQRRRRTTKAASHSLGAPCSRIARRPGSSVKSLEVTNTTGQPSCSLAWKWR